MKRIEDIEILSPQQLEEASCGIGIPEGFDVRLKERLLAEGLSAGSMDPGTVPARRRMFAPVTFTAFAVAAAIAAILLIQRPSMPEDSFDDPMLAYAQVEQTLQYISSKMAGGISLVRDAETAASMPESIIEKINGR